MSCENNRIHSTESTGSGLFKLDHQRVVMSALVFEDNVCTDSADWLSLSKNGKFDGELSSDWLHRDD